MSRPSPPPAVSIPADTVEPLAVNAETHITPDDAATATEETPLLSGSSSTTLRNGTATPSSSPPNGRPRADSTVPNHPVGWLRGSCVALGVFTLMYIQATNMTGMAMIQGSIASDLNAYESAMWFTTAFFIPTSALTPIAGRLAAVFSPRSLALPIGILIAGGCLVSSQAQTFSVFILGRVLTGAGGAGVLTMSVILVLELTSKRRRGLFIGLANSSMTVGVSVGAIFYGGLLPIIGWRALLWLQAPFSLFACLLIYFSIPPSMSSAVETKPGTTLQKLARLDYLGALLLISTLVLFLYGLAGEITLWPLLASLGSLIAFLAVEYLVAGDPIIPLKVLSSPGVLLSCLSQLGFVTARWSVIFFSPIFMLAVRGAEPAAAGSILIPTNLGFGVAGTLVGVFHIRRTGSFWLPTIVCMAFFAASLFFLSALGHPASALWTFILVVFVNGVATGAGFNYTLAHCLHLSHHDTQYITSSLLNTFRGFGGSFGTAIGGGIFQRLLRSSLTAGFLGLDGGEELAPGRLRLISKLLGSPSMVYHGGLENGEMQVALDGYGDALQGVWKASATLAILVIVVQAATGWKVPKEKEDTVEDWDESEAAPSNRAEP